MLSKGAILLTLPLLLTACFGRPQVQTRASVTLTTLGLNPGMPAVIAFSALWCHPCREEIDSLNQGNKEFGGQVQILGYLVEGEEKGAPVQESDIAQFTSFDGQSPSYPIRLDSGWQLFDSLHAPQGRALPTLMVVDQNGKILQIVQQSLDYDTQLRPLLQALANGQSTPPVNATPTPAPNAGQQLNDTVQNWSLRPEVAAQPQLMKNLNDSWQTGLQKYDFTISEMPLAAGKINFSWDGKDLDIPETVSWKADTPASVCQLQLTLKPDASLLSASGSCRPK